VKTLEIENATLDSCVDTAKADGRIVITRNGQPVAIVVDVSNLDQEQVELGADDAFWSMIRERRNEPTVSRTVLEERINGGKKAEKP
jgi:prevent-host-death family protein